MTLFDLLNGTGLLAVDETVSSSDGLRVVFLPIA